MNGLRDAMAKVVEAGNCSGCGACALLSPSVTMNLDDSGYWRPQMQEGGDEVSDAVFQRICPGAEVRAPNNTQGIWHPTMGRSEGVWKAWACDEATRHRGSSGGVLTALAEWLIDQGEVTSMVSAAADHKEPQRTRSVRIVDRDTAFASAGSRYAPVGNAGCSLGAGEGFIGKPCEASAVRNYHRELDLDAALILSFYCAGTPRQSATDDLVAELADGQAITDMWYRGRGWPGKFTIQRADGSTASVTYDESWGRRLGPATQWRCKMCVDGVGEAADVVAADYWETDERGYPSFAEGQGFSALIARTPRGLDIVQRAVRDGAIFAEPITPDDLASVQPLQVQRRTTLMGRLLGTRLAGRPVPRYRGFHLWRLAMRHPGENWRAFRGAFRRARAAQVPGQGKA